YYEKTKKAVSEGQDSTKKSTSDAISDVIKHGVDEFVAAEEAAKDAVKAASRGSRGDFVDAMEVVGDWYAGMYADVEDIEKEMQDIPMSVLDFLLGDTFAKEGDIVDDIDEGLAGLFGGINFSLDGALGTVFAWVEPAIKAIATTLAYCLSWFSERLEDLLMIPAHAFFQMLSYILFKEKK
ncbi:unnamed protein product, partial [marine sediment metagenome]